MIWPDWNVETLAVKLSGVAGAIVSMRFLTGTWPERLFTALCGAITSFFITPYLAEKIGLPAGLTGFLVGLFGMAIASRMWEWVQTTPIAAVWNIALDWLRRMLGGKTAEKDER